MQDADSETPQGEKKEGAFYIWSEAEIDEVLGPEGAPIFKQHYFVKSGGNTTLSPQSDPHNEFAGLNCLIERSPLEVTAKKFGAFWNMLIVLGLEALSFEISGACSSGCSSRALPNALVPYGAVHAFFLLDNLSSDGTHARVRDGTGLWCRSMRPSVSPRT